MRGSKEPGEFRNTHMNAAMPSARRERPRQHGSVALAHFAFFAPRAQLHARHVNCIRSSIRRSGASAAFALLNGDPAVHCIDDAGELGEHTVARAPGYVPAARSDEAVDDNFDERTGVAAARQQSRCRSRRTLVPGARLRANRRYVFWPLRIQTPEAARNSR